MCQQDNHQYYLNFAKKTSIFLVKNIIKLQCIGDQANCVTLEGVTCKINREYNTNYVLQKLSSFCKMMQIKYATSNICPMYLLGSNISKFFTNLHIFFNENKTTLLTVKLFFLLYRVLHHWCCIILQTSKSLQLINVVTMIHDLFRSLKVPFNSRDTILTVIWALNVI